MHEVAFPGRKLARPVLRLSCRIFSSSLSHQTAFKCLQHVAIRKRTAHTTWARYSEDNEQGSEVCAAAWSDTIDFVRCCRLSAADDRVSFAVVLSDVMIPVSQTNPQSNVLLSSTVSGQQASVHRKEHFNRIPNASKLSSPRQKGSARRSDVSRAVATTEAPARPASGDQLVREGSYESPLVQLQVGCCVWMPFDLLG